MRARLYLLSLAILIGGLCAGIAVYVLAEDVDDAGDGYVIVYGQKHPAGVYQSKRYVREVERFGGKAFLIFGELDRWLASLWQGKQLGVTLASLGVAAALALLQVARLLFPEPSAVSSPSLRKNPTEEKDL